MPENIHSYKVIIPYREPTYEVHSGKAHPNPYNALYYVTALTKSEAINNALKLFDEDVRNAQVGWIRNPEKIGIIAESIKGIEINKKFSKGVFRDFYSGKSIRNNPEIIPDSHGIYAVCRCDLFDLIFVGQAKGKEANSGSLRHSICNEHLKGYTRHSPLRLLVSGELHIPKYKENTGRYAVEPHYEVAISDFINSELFFSFIAADWDKVDDLENTAIKVLNPKWNQKLSPGKNRNVTLRRRKSDWK
jgi:hypothetical protein